jgi:hypothetical protein
MWTDLGKTNTSDPRIAPRKPIGMPKAAHSIADSMGYSLKELALLDRIIKLKDVFFLNFSLLFTYVLILNREGSYVPSNNEFVYLLYLAKLWDPNFLSNDWTFSGPLPSHLVFNFVFGPLTLAFPLEVVGWIGRILSWSLILLAILQLGKHFRIPLWMITVSILFWLFYRQSIVGGEWILGTFEAKSIAYVLLLFSLNGFMYQKLIWPSILLGLAFSFHPVVSLWGGLGVGLSLIVLRYPLGAIIRFACYTSLFALPGLIPLLMRGVEGGPESSEAWRFITLVLIPYHFDPFYFGSSKPHLLLMTVLLCFNWLQFMSGSKSHALQFLLSFQIFLGFFFILGFLARFTESYELLMLMPCRLFPVLLPLFFFFHFMRALHYFYSLRSGMALVMAGFLALASFGNPVTIFSDRISYHYHLLTRQEDDLEKTFKWISKNTSANSIILSPPWRNDSFYLSQRSQIVSSWIPRWDRLTEWRERLESVGGDLSAVRIRNNWYKESAERMAHHYNQLKATEIASLIEKYGAEYLVSSATYDYPVLLRSGVYKVYSLRRDAVCGTNS